MITVFFQRDPHREAAWPVEGGFTGESSVLADVSISFGPRSLFDLTTASVFWSQTYVQFFIEFQL